MSGYDEGYSDGYSAASRISADERNGLVARIAELEAELAVRGAQIAQLTEDVTLSNGALMRRDALLREAVEEMGDGGQSWWLDMRARIEAELEQK